MEEALKVLDMKAGAIPGVSIVASFLTNALLDGSANALLTLRVGAIAKQYCNPLNTANKSLVRRNASAAAAALLGSIVV